MDLDRGSLDRSSLDRSDKRGLYAICDSNGDVYASLLVGGILNSHADSSGDAEASLIVGAILSAHVDSSGDVFAWLSGGSTPTRTITFSGTLAAGKTLIIDGQRFTVLNDGVNAIGDFTGDFPILFPGVNLLKYTDSEGSRTIHIHVVKPGPPSTTEIPATLTLTYTGTLAAGKVLVIDGNDLTVENDGTNDLAHFTGDFPFIFPGANTITYTD
ncbi:MAG: hypothetical protein WC455_27275, partial [Dehalococcoidia bacterium]